MNVRPACKISGFSTLIICVPAWSVWLEDQAGEGPAALSSLVVFAQKSVEDDVKGDTKRNSIIHLDNIYIYSHYVT